VAALCKKESELSYTPSLEEIEAGINDFAQYGAFNYIYSLTGGDPLKEEAFYSLAWSSVFMYRKISLDNYLFRKRLQKPQTPNVNT